MARIICLGGWHWKIELNSVKMSLAKVTNVPSIWKFTSNIHSQLKYFELRLHLERRSFCRKDQFRVGQPITGDSLPVSWIRYQETIECFLYSDNFSLIIYFKAKEGIDEYFTLCTVFIKVISFIYEKNYFGDRVPFNCHNPIDNTAQPETQHQQHNQQLQELQINNY